MAQHPKCPDPNHFAELIVDLATGSAWAEARATSWLMALVDTIMFKPGDRIGGCPGVNRPDVASWLVCWRPERQALGLGERRLDLMEA
jgi:hypothetical protein